MINITLNSSFFKMKILNLICYEINTVFPYHFIIPRCFLWTKWKIKKLIYDRILKTGSKCYYLSLLPRGEKYKTGKISIENYNQNVVLINKYFKKNSGYRGLFYKYLWQFCWLWKKTGWHLCQWRNPLECKRICSSDKYH